MRKIVILILLFLPLLAFAADWPQWHGPNRDGVSAEGGLLKAWPAGGPRLLWSVDGLGSGYSSAVIAGDAVFTTGDVNSEGFLFRFDRKGMLQWKVSYGPDGVKAGPYARSTPTVEGDRLYLMTARGAVLCLDARTGERKWAVDTAKDFLAREPSGKYGISESLVIAGDIVICTPGGEKASVVGINKFTGQVAWATTEIHEESGYNQPLVIPRGKRLLAVVMTAWSLLGIDAADGKVLWRVPFAALSGQCFTPLFANGILYAPTGPSCVAQGFTLSDDGAAITKVWQQNRMTVNMGGVVILDGYVYGTNGNFRALCLDIRNGNIMYESIRRVGLAAVIAADGLLIMYTTDGNLRLVKANPKSYELLGEFKVTLGAGPHWAHPALSDGVLYIRHGEVLMAYEVKGK